jgi:hypothetical protein
VWSIGRSVGRSALVTAGCRWLAVWLWLPVVWAQGAPRATQLDHPSAGRRECGAPLLNACVGTAPSSSSSSSSREAPAFIPSPCLCVRWRGAAEKSGVTMRSDHTIRIIAKIRMHSCNLLSG